MYGSSKDKTAVRNIINSITVGSDHIVEICSVRNPGVQINNEIKKERQVLTVSKACYLQLRLID